VLPHADGPFLGDRAGQAKVERRLRRYLAGEAGADIPLKVESVTSDRKTLPRALIARRKPDSVSTGAIVHSTTLCFNACAVSAASVR
jgi:hypothetical protein